MAIVKQPILCKVEVTNKIIHESYPSECQNNSHREAHRGQKIDGSYRETEEWYEI